VQYVRFRLSPAAVAGFVAGAAPVEIVIDHPNYRERATLDGAQRASLARDLAVT